MIGPQSLPEEQLTVNQDREMADALTVGSHASYPARVHPGEGPGPPN
jgi:hypothetical protein